MKNQKPKIRLELSRRQLFGLIFNPFYIGFCVAILIFAEPTETSGFIIPLMIMAGLANLFSIYKKMKNPNQSSEPTLKTPAESVDV